MNTHYYLLNIGDAPGCMSVGFNHPRYSWIGPFFRKKWWDICTCMHPPAVIIFPLASTGDMLKSSEGAETFCNVTTRGLMITQNWAELKDCIVTFKYLSWWGNHRAKMLNILWHMCQDMKLGFTLMHSGSTTATASRKLLMCCLRSS